MTDYKTKVAIYLRKSRMDPEEEDIDETLNRHSDELMKYAKNNGLTIIAIYKEVVSGDGLFTRPEMVRLLKDVESGAYTAVLCMAIDRLGRSSQKDGGIILETFKEHDVMIITPQKTYDLNDDIDETTVEMQTFLARQELKLIKRRLTTGLKKSLEEGCHVAEPPYGYRRTYIDKKPTLEIHDEEANTVRMIFDMYVNQCLGSYTIANRLNAMGLSPRKSSRFSRTTVQFILQNPIYIGKIVWNKKHRVKKKSITDKNRYVVNDKDKWIVSDALHPPIVDKELYDRAQEIRKEKSHPPSYTGTLRNPFAGLVFCGNCGFAIVRQYMTSKKHESLLCPNSGCTRSVEMHTFENEVLKIMWDTFKKVQASPDTFKDNTSNVNSLIIQMKNLKKELATVEKQRMSLHDFLEQGVYDTQTFLSRNKILSDKKSEIQKLIDDTRSKIKEKETSGSLKGYIPIFEELLYNYDTLSPSDKNELYKKLIKRMTYTHTPDQKRTEFNLEIEFKFEV